MVKHITKKRRVLKNKGQKGGKLFSFRKKKSEGKWIKQASTKHIYHYINEKGETAFDAATNEPITCGCALDGSEDLTNKDVDFNISYLSQYQSIFDTENYGIPNKNGCKVCGEAVKHIQEHHGMMSDNYRLYCNKHWKLNMRKYYKKKDLNIYWKKNENGDMVDEKPMKDMSSMSIKSNLPTAKQQSKATKQTVRNSPSTKSPSTRQVASSLVETAARSQGGTTDISSLSPAKFGQLFNNVTGIGGKKSKRRRKSKRKRKRRLKTKRRRRRRRR